MVKYEFKAKDPSGKTKTGVIRAENLNDFYAKLKEQNLFCISVTESAIQGSDAPMAVGGGSHKLRLQDIAIFCRQFATMINSGLTVVKCLDILYRQAENKRLKNCLLELYESIKKGNGLSYAMKEQGKAFPQLLISMVESGEASGKLDDVMMSMSSHYEKEKILRNKVQTAMIYPILLIVVAIAVIIILLTCVMPVFFDLFGDPANLPAATKVLVAASNFMTKYWYILLIIVAALVVGGFFLFQVESFRIAFDKFKLKMPVVGKLQQIICTARFSRTVSSLYGGGVAIIESIKISAGVLGNKYLAQQLDLAMSEIKQGIPFSTALTNINTFPAMFTSMVYIGEESGALDSILEKTANFYDEDAQAATAKMVALLEPCMLVVLGLIVGFVVVAIMQAMFGSYNFVA